MSWRDELSDVDITPTGGEDIRRLKEAEEVERGRVVVLPHMKTGACAHQGDRDRNVMQVERERLGHIAADEGTEIARRERQRNPIVRETHPSCPVSTRVAGAVLERMRQNQPCTHLNMNLKRDACLPLLKRTVLKCAAVMGGMIRPGDALTTREV